MAKMKLKQIHLTISEELYERLRNVNKYNLSFNKQLTIICINYLKKVENYSKEEEKDLINKTIEKKEDGKEDLIDVDKLLDDIKGL